MNVGYEIKDGNDVWDCVSGGRKFTVFKKRVTKKIQLHPNGLKGELKKEDLHYLQYVSADDIPAIIEYLEIMVIRYRRCDLVYVLREYCGLKSALIANALKITKVSVCRAINYIVNGKTVDKADELARTIGYWKYKKLDKSNEEF